MKNNKIFKSILVMFMLLVLCTPMVVKAAVYQGAKLDSSISLPKFSYQQDQKGKIIISVINYNENLSSIM